MPSKRYRVPVRINLTPDQITDVQQAINLFHTGQTTAPPIGHPVSPAFHAAHYAIHRTSEQLVVVDVDLTDGSITLGSQDE